MKFFGRFAKVRAKDGRMTTIPCNSVGRVVRQDFERSMAGYDSLIVWTTKLGGRRRHTWYPSSHLVPATHPASFR